VIKDHYSVYSQVSSENNFAIVQNKQFCPTRVKLDSMTTSSKCNDKETIIFNYILINGYSKKHQHGTDYIIFLSPC
jgi:hypothetical protein